MSAISKRIQELEAVEANIRALLTEEKSLWEARSVLGYQTLQRKP